MAVLAGALTTAARTSSTMAARGKGISYQYARSLAVSSCGTSQSTTRLQRGLRESPERALRIGPVHYRRPRRLPAPRLQPTREFSLGRHAPPPARCPRPRGTARKRRRARARSAASSVSSSRRAASAAWAACRSAECGRPRCCLWSALLPMENVRPAFPDALPVVPFHGLRHSTATIALTVGPPVNVVSRRLRHASPDITLRVYAHVTAGATASMAAQMDALRTHVSNVAIFVSKPALTCGYPVARCYVPAGRGCSRSIPSAPQAVVARRPAGIGPGLPPRGCFPFSC